MNNLVSAVISGLLLIAGGCQERGDAHSLLARSGYTYEKSCPPSSAAAKLESFGAGEIPVTLQLPAGSHLVSDYSFDGLQSMVWSAGDIHIGLMSSPEPLDVFWAAEYDAGQLCREVVADHPAIVSVAYTDDTFIPGQAASSVWKLEDRWISLRASSRDSTDLPLLLEIVRSVKVN